MEGTTGIVPTMNVGQDGFGSNSWFWIIILLFFFWGNNGNNNDIARESTMLNQFNERDLFAINQNVSQNRYDNAIGQASLSKDILLGNAEITKDILLGNQTLASSMASCCCEIKSLVRDEVQSVKDLINNNTIQELRDTKQGYELVAALGNQSQNILNSLGNYYPKIGVNPYAVYNSCGCNGTII